MDVTDVSLDELWDSVSGRDPARFDPAQIAHHPEPVRRYLTHAIAPGTPLARAVRLRMAGEIRLNDWVPFEAEQVIAWDRGLIWKAKAKMMPGISIKGSDRMIDGEGAMRWKLLGLIPIIREDGPDISRSAAGRLEVESIWLPSVLLDQDVRWTVVDDDRIRAHVYVPGDANDVDFHIDADGRLLDVRIARWGNPEGGAFHDVPFGGALSDEGTFHGYTVPTAGRIGWFFGTERFEEDGEFFRAEFTDFQYR